MRIESGCRETSANNDNRKGYIMQIQPFSVNDGEGIRTTIFMAGCPLRCQWCANPEGLEMRPRVGWYQRKCIGCGRCSVVCPEGIGINIHEGMDKCTSCGLCADVCPEESRKRMVTLTDADDVLRQIGRHRLFYSYSGGGITFSGGEATMQRDFLDYLSSEIYDMGYSMDIETCGLFDWEKTAPILERMDLIFMDLKMMDPERHRFYTGSSNERILENIARLADLGTGSDNGNSAVRPPDVVIRIPVIAGVNDDDENILSSAAYVHDHLPDARMELLPYHRLGAVKYEALGMPYDHPEFRTPSIDEISRLRELVKSEGVRLADYR